MKLTESDLEPKNAQAPLPESQAEQDDYAQDGIRVLERLANTATSIGLEGSYGQPTFAVLAQKVQIKSTKQPRKPKEKKGRPKLTTHHTHLGGDRYKIDTDK